jgi:hypothetical protein
LLLLRFSTIPIAFVDQVSYGVLNKTHNDCHNQLSQ